MGKNRVVISAGGTNLQKDKRVSQILLKIISKQYDFALFLQTIEKWYDSVAQLVEQYTFNVWALGSSPSGITKSFNIFIEAFLFKISAL